MAGPGTCWSRLAARCARFSLKGMASGIKRKMSARYCLTNQDRSARSSSDSDVAEAASCVKMASQSAASPSSMICGWRPWNSGGRWEPSPGMRRRVR
ncbi:hypothetical protein D3C72_2147270 [compost metagenome]